MTIASHARAVSPSFASFGAAERVLGRALVLGWRRRWLSDCAGAEALGIVWGAVAGAAAGAARSPYAALSGALGIVWAAVSG